MPSSSSHHHKHKASSSSASSKKHRRRHEEEDGNDSDVSSASSIESVHVLEALRPTSANVKRGGAGGSAVKKGKSGGMQELARAVQDDPSIGNKINFLFTAMQDHVLPRLEYVSTAIKAQEEEDALQAKRLKKEMKKKKRKHTESSSEDEGDERAGKKEKQKGKGKGKGKGALIPMKDKWAKMLAAKLEQAGSLGQAPFTKERSLSIREHYHVVPEDAEALFGDGALMQPTPHNKPHSALYVYKFWGDEVTKLFAPIPFPLERQALLYTKEGAAIAAAKKAAKKAEKEGGGGAKKEGKAEEEGAGAEGDETEDEDGGSNKSKSGKDDESGGGVAILKPCPVVCRWMEARHNKDKLSLTLVFGFEQDPDAEEEDAGSEEESD